MAKHIITKFWKENPLDSLKKLNIMKILSFNTFLCLRPCLPSEIIDIKAVLVACFYVFPNSESIHSYKKREQATKTDVRQNISL